MGSEDASVVVRLRRTKQQLAPAESKQGPGDTPPARWARASRGLVTRDRAAGPGQIQRNGQRQRVVNRRRARARSRTHSTVCHTSRPPRNHHDGNTPARGALPEGLGGGTAGTIAPPLPARHVPSTGAPCPISPTNQPTPRTQHSATERRNATPRGHFFFNLIPAPPRPVRTSPSAPTGSATSHSASANAQQGGSGTPRPAPPARGAVTNTTCSHAPVKIAARVARAPIYTWPPPACELALALPPALNREGEERARLGEGGIGIGSEFPASVCPATATRGRGAARHSARSLASYRDQGGGDWRGTGRARARHRAPLATPLPSRRLN